LDRDVETVDIFTLDKICEITSISELVFIVAIGSNFQFEDAIFMGIILNFEQFDEIPLNQHVLADLAFGEVVARNRYFVCSISLCVIIYSSDGH
jgi:hypothetical protein